MKKQNPRTHNFGASHPGFGASKTSRLSGNPGFRKREFLSQLQSQLALRKQCCSTVKLYKQWKDCNRYLKRFCLNNMPWFSQLVQYKYTSTYTHCVHSSTPTAWW